MAYTRAIGPVEISDDPAVFDPDLILSAPTAMPDAKANEKALTFLEEARKNCDSVGGCMECIVTGLPAGIGDPVFEKLDANLAKAIMSIGAVKAVEIGDGMEASRHKGSENNDPFLLDAPGAGDGVDSGILSRIRTAGNRHGGALGGMSSGMPIVFRAAVKPTPSIGLPQDSVDLASGKNTTLVVSGRHDPCIVPRAVPVVEAAAACVLYDSLLEAKTWN